MLDAQTAHTKKKIEIDAERLRSSITRLTSSSTDELERLISELETLQEFLKSETERGFSALDKISDF